MPPPPANLYAPELSDHNARSSRFAYAVAWFAAGTELAYAFGAVQSNTACPLTATTLVPVPPEHGDVVGGVLSVAGTQPVALPPMRMLVVLHMRRTPPVASMDPVRTITWARSELAPVEHMSAAVVPHVDRTQKPLPLLRLMA